MTTQGPRKTHLPALPGFRIASIPVLLYLDPKPPAFGLQTLAKSLRKSVLEGWSMVAWGFRETAARGSVRCQMRYQTMHSSGPWQMSCWLQRCYWIRFDPDETQLERHHMVCYSDRLDSIRYLPLHRMPALSNGQAHTEPPHRYHKWFAESGYLSEAAPRQRCVQWALYSSLPRIGLSQRPEGARHASCFQENVHSPALQIGEDLKPDLVAS